MSRQDPLANRGCSALNQLSAETFLVNPRELCPGAFQGLNLMRTGFGGLDPEVAESAATSTPALDTGWHPIWQRAAITVTAEETARAIRPQGLVVVPVQAPPRSVLAIAWRHRGHPAPPGRFPDFRPRLPGRARMAG